MIKEIDFEKNYAATKVNKNGCHGESRQNEGVTTKVRTNSAWTRNAACLVSSVSNVLRLPLMSQIKTPSGIGRYRQNVTERNFEIFGGRPKRKRLQSSDQKGAPKKIEDISCTKSVKQILPPAAK